MIGVNLKFWKV